jgi:hypothetical protein
LFKLCFEVVFDFARDLGRRILRRKLAAPLCKVISKIYFRPARAHISFNQRRSKRNNDRDNCKPKCFIVPLLLLLQASKHGYKVREVNRVPVWAYLYGKQFN